jgi:molybdopterin converting factor small subunit
MSTVRIPPVLRSSVGGAKQIDVPGTTVGEVVETLVSHHPELRDRLLTPDGELNRFVNVFVDGDDVRHLDGPATAVRDDATILLLPAMAGGA